MHKMMTFSLLKFIILPFFFGSRLTKLIECLVIGFVKSRKTRKAHVLFVMTSSECESEDYYVLFPVPVPELMSACG